MAKTPPFKPIVDNRGYYTDQYIHWAIQRDNFVESGFARITLGSDNSRKFNGVDYANAPSLDESKTEAMKSVDKIRRMGGLARITPVTRRGKRYWATWFNPNGEEGAFHWVEGW